MYVGHLPVAEKRLKDEIETNSEFRLFLEVGVQLVYYGLVLMFWNDLSNAPVIPMLVALI